MKVRNRAALCVSLVVGVAAPATAHAWYFPEHAELTRLGLQDASSPFTRRVIADTVAAAAADGLMLCDGTPLPFERVALERDDVAQCVPYGALAALAGDHSSTTSELRQALSVAMFRPWPNNSVQLARLLTGAAATTWRAYFANVSTGQLRIWTGPVRDSLASIDSDVGRTLKGRNFIARLDVELLAIDPDYVSRAAGSESHFHNAGLPVHQILDNLVAGDLDNALAQVLVHHSRSLQLAVRARSVAPSSARNSILSEALLEHAFALHFLEDAFAAGHIATDPAFSVAERRKQRHDYFNRQGLEVTYALDSGNCGHDVDQDDGQIAVSANSVHPRPSRCWVAHGDGYAAMPDRVHVGDAVARLQTEFALAAWAGPCDDASGCVESANFLYGKNWKDERRHSMGAGPANHHLALFPKCPAVTGTRLSCNSHDVDGRNEGHGCGSETAPPNRDPCAQLPCGRRYNDKLSSLMSWTVPNPKYDCDVQAVLPTIDQLEDALMALGTAPLAPPRSSGDPATQRFVGDRVWLGCPLKSRENGNCDYNLAAGSALLWRAILAVWPASTASLETLEGSDTGDDGSSIQLNFGLSVGCIRPFLCSKGVTLGIAGTVGYAYRLAGLFPHRRALAVAELNVGPAFIARLGGAGGTAAGGERVLGAVAVEARSPLTTFLVYLMGYTWRSRKPVGLIGNPLAVGFFGARTILEPRGSGFDLRGWDVELLDYRLDSGEVPSPAAVGAAQDTELRVHLGVANFDRSMKDLTDGSIMLNVDVASGYYRFF